MKKIVLILLSLTFSSFMIAQQTEKINLFLDDDGNVSLETKYLQTATISQQFQNWISSFPENVNGEIISINSREFCYKGCVPIFLSEKPSVFQTEMHFTLSIHSEENQIIAAIKDIYYQSYPEYGKQGTPSIISYPKDWYSKAKLRKKTGKLPWLNRLVKENTISKSEELLASGDEFFK